MEEIIKNYFRLGYTYNEILTSLFQIHGISVSLRKLHRILRRNGLYRKSNKSSFDQVIEFVSEQLEGSGSSIGYRQMHQRCIMHGFRVNRSNVLTILQQLDPDGIELRKRHCLRRRNYYSQGPNWVWHVDGYDKLKPYGFSIHGAIDGYSRRVMWLNLTRSNKNPKNVCDFFMNTCIEIEGIPKKIVADRGTENVYLAASQRFLRRGHGDSAAGEKSFQYGKSVSNQRIEAWWSLLRRTCTNWWMNYFKDLVTQGIYDLTDNIQVECMRFTHGPVIATELKRMKESWNTHRIRPSANHDMRARPAGRPNVLFFTPHEGIENHMKIVDAEDIDIIRQLCCNSVTPDFICSVDFFELASIIMQEHGLEMPNNANRALLLYTQLLDFIRQI